MCFFAHALLVTELRCNDRSNRTYMNSPVPFWYLIWLRHDLACLLAGWLAGLLIDDDVDGGEWKEHSSRVYIIHSCTLHRIHEKIFQLSAIIIVV